MRSERLSVLAADDDVSILHLMERILELEGYHVFTASNGDAAPDTFVQETPDLVLLDAKMPDMDGYSVCQRIREFSQMPIIVVTVKNDVEDEVRGFHAGADDYVTKPFSLSVLTARI